MDCVDTKEPHKRRIICVICKIRRKCLTTVGMPSSSNGNFRPNLLIINPNKRLPNSAPIPSSDAIQLPSSKVTLPDCNGDSSDVIKSKVGLGQPSVIPYEIESRFTVCNVTKFSPNELKTKFSKIQWIIFENYQQMPPHTDTLYLFLAFSLWWFDNLINKRSPISSTNRLLVY